MWVGLLLLFTSLGLHAQEQGAERFNVLYLNMAHGLPNNYVDDIFADSDGFVWIATHGGGLMRYDGFSILDFGVGSPGLQLPSNSCRNICEDTFHRLWVSFDEFTAVLDLNTLKPATLTTPRQDVSVQKVLQERSLHVCCDEKGKIWVVTMDNIYCIVFDERGDVEQLYRFATHSNTPDVFIGDLDGDGKPWAAFGGSLRKPPMVLCLQVAGRQAVSEPQLPERVHHCHEEALPRPAAQHQHQGPGPLGDRLLPQAHPLLE